MKFDKFMSFCYRILCFSLACLLLAGSVVSCARPVRASAAGADPVDVLGEVRDFKDQYLHNLSVVASAITTDLQNGNFDASSSVGQQIMQSLALQTALGSWITGYYGQPNLEITWNDFEQIPSTITVVGSSASGFYRTSQDGDIKVCNLITVPTTNSGIYSTFITAPDFSFRFEAPSGVYAGFEYQTPSYRTPYYEFGVSNFSNEDLYFGYIGSGLGLTEASTGHGYGFSRNIYISSSSIPVFTSSFALNALSESNPLCGYGVYSSLPSGDAVDKETPWTYYNDVLLDYMENNFSDVPDVYFVFPNGYDPDADPDAPLLPSQNIYNYYVAPPIILGAGAVVAVGGVDFNVFVPVSANPQFTIDGINFQFPQIDNDLHRVWIDSTPYSFPTPEIDIKGHTVEVPDLLRIVVDGVVFYLTEDPTLLINDLIEMALPVGTPDMSPSEAYDYEYYFPTETLADIRLPDSTLPNSVALPSGVTSALPALWAYIYDFIDACGILSILPFLLTASVCAYVVHRLGS